MSIGILLFLLAGVVYRKFRLLNSILRNPILVMCIVLILVEHILELLRLLVFLHRK